MMVDATLRQQFGGTSEVANDELEHVLLGIQRFHGMLGHVGVVLE